MSEINFAQEGIVFDIQRFSIHDGPGIRTIVFLKGCPLACRWCCNPESQQLAPVVMYRQASCVHCGRCRQVCKRGALSLDHPGFIDRTRCTGCGACADVCPAGALTMKGRTMTVSQVVKELQKDATSFRRSGGGVTLSGGEPLMQSAFALELLKACKERGWSTAMETTGFAPKAVVEQIMPLVDHALVDLKAINPAVHEAQTGVSNRLILENAIRIATLTASVVRIPLIPGVNADSLSLTAIARFAQLMPGVDTIHILPFHTYGENKYALLGRPYPIAEAEPLSKEAVAGFHGIIEGTGLKCVIGG